MAPLYRHLAHPTEGILNNIGEGSVSQPSRTRRGSSTVSPLFVLKKPVLNVSVPWSEELYEKLKAENEKELESLRKQEEEAKEKAGDTEILTARAKRAEYYARIGDKDQALTAYNDLLETTGSLGTKIDIVFAIIRIGLFFGDKLLVKRNVERASSLVESGGDWDRRNRLKAYQGLHLMTVRAYNLAAPLLLDSLSTFTSYELCSYSKLIVYALLAGTVSLKRVDFKSKVVDSAEIKAVVGTTEDRIAALTGATSSGPGAGDEEMPDATSASATAPKTATVKSTTTPKPAKISITEIGDGIYSKEVDQPDLKPMANLVSSLYTGNYREFFNALGEVERDHLSQDRYLAEHRAWFVREMRLRAYQQLLQSYRVVGLASMASDFGVTEDFLDNDLKNFIAGDRISCTVDRVNGVIETNRSDDKNKQYNDVVKQGDQLITKLQKYGQNVRMRGSEGS